MAFGINRAQSAEQDRQRVIRQVQAQEEAADTSDNATAPAQGAAASTTTAPAVSQAPEQPSHAAGGVRPGGGFRPGGNSRPITREQEEARMGTGGVNVSVAVEDGVSSVQVIRRLLEVAAVRRWPHTQVTRLELLAHEDPSSAWSKVSSAWEQLCEDRRQAVSSRDGEQICFRIVSGDVARESRPTGPRATSMALLHGLDMVRLPVDRSPFSPEVVSMVATHQRNLRQAAQAQAAAPSTSVAPEQVASLQVETQVRPQSQQPAADPPASPGRFVRQARR